MTAASAASDRASARVGVRLPGDLPAAAAAWTLGAVPVAYLGLRGGGFDPLVHTGSALVVWWAVLLGVATGVLDLARTSAVARVAIGSLIGLAALTVASTTWSASPDGAAAESMRVVLYAGVLLLAVTCPRQEGSARRVLAGVATAIVVVAAVAVVGRLRLEGTGIVDGTRRLSRPLDYWNGLALLCAVGVPLLLGLARSCRSIVTAAAAAAAVPLLVLVISLTGSRGGVLELAVAVGAFLLLTGDRLAGLATTLAAGGGSALLLAAAKQRGDLLPGTDRDVGSAVAMIVVVLVGTALLQVGISLLATHAQRPRWLTPTPRRTAVALLTASAVAAAGLVAVGTPHAVADRWDAFTGAPSADLQPLTTSTNVLDRLGYASGVGRYQMWQQAAELFRDEPLVGAGAGSFEATWAQARPAGAVFARNAHSLYLETLGTLGVVGLLLLLGLLLSVLGAGCRGLATRRFDDRSLAAAAVAAVLAFAVGAALDWVWQIPAIVVAMLLAGSTLLPARGTPRPSRTLVTVALGAAVLAIAVLAVGLTATTNLRESRKDAREGRLVAAARSASTAAAITPFAADPQLQLALVLERGGALREAAQRARRATQLEPTGWSNWYVLSRVLARRGDAPGALAAYRKARALNPRSPIFVSR